MSAVIIVYLPQDFPITPILTFLGTKKALIFAKVARLDDEKKSDYIPHTTPYNANKTAKRNKTICSPQFMSRALFLSFSFSILLTFSPSLFLLFSCSLFFSLSPLLFLSFYCFLVLFSPTSL